MKTNLCPRDAAALETHPHLRQNWYACKLCQGMFLPLSMRLELAALQDQIALRAAEWPRSNIGCPQCGRTLHLAHYQGVEIDLCLHCRAVWLDKGEADKIDMKQTIKYAKDDVKWSIATQEALDGFSGMHVGGALDWLGDALGALLRP